MRSLSQKDSNVKIGQKLLLAMTLIILGGCRVVDAPKPEVYVSAAASLQESLEELATLFEGAEVRLNFGGSNVLKRQIIEGFDVDVFLSAHENQVKALDVKMSTPFAKNEVVLVSSGNIKSFEDVTREGIRLIFAHEAVPIGGYTQEILARMDADFPGFRAATEANVISRGENVRQVLLQVSLGEGDGAFVYGTDARIAGDSVMVIPVPEPYGVVTELHMALLSAVPEAHEFYEFVLSDVGQEVFARHGFK